MSVCLCLSKANPYFTFLIDIYIFRLAAAIAYSVQRLDMRWKGVDSNRGACEIFRTPPEQPEAPHSELSRGYRVCFPGVKSSVREVNHLTLITADIKERIWLYFYSLSESSRPLVGRILRFFTFYVF